MKIYEYGKDKEKTILLIHPAAVMWDFFIILLGKIGGLGLLKKAFSTDEYSEKDLEYIAEVLRFMTTKTIWRSFESCNNYSMPKDMPLYKGKLEYWYGEKEEKDRSWDIKYVKNAFPNAKFFKLKNRGNASMASLYPQEMAERIISLLENNSRKLIQAENNRVRKAKQNN